MIFVNKPYLPSKQKYIQYLDRIWDSHYLTNFGPLSQELEAKLCEYLNVKHILFVSNGTLALQVAYKIAGLKKGDEVITTPFSFAATTNTLAWEHLKLKFCDIESQGFCIDTTLIDSCISVNTKAIVPVHVFGNPCDVKHLESIAKTHNIKLIYDAAHAFGVTYDNKSIFHYGDIATLSFHATKLFHSIEGGAIITKDSNSIEYARECINFGLQDGLPHSLGINAKNSEFHAAMGLCVLDDMEYIMENRQNAWEYYYTHLKDYFTMQTLNPHATNNFHYFPILFTSETKLISAIHALKEAQIFPRRYFYPSLESLDFITNTNSSITQYCPISQDIASRILCLPFYVGIEKEVQDKIIAILKAQA